MKLTVSPGRFSAAKWACLLSAVGFAYALATSVPGASWASGPDASPRALGTDATRPPVQFVTGANLGAVVVGSQFARQILVQFGFKPHKFTFGDILPVSQEMSLSAQGKLIGKIDNPGVEFFDVVVTDSPAGQVLPPISQTF